MKTSELRIGNLLEFSNGIQATKIVTVDRRFFSSATIEKEDGDFEITPYYKAIPLTEEWLLKFGFENNIHGNWNRYFKDGIYPRSFAFQFYKNGRVDFWYGDFNVGNLNSIKYNPLQYVHQLQNLYFALTGKELEYEQN